MARSYVVWLRSIRAEHSSSPTGPTLAPARSTVRKWGRSKDLDAAIPHR